MKTNPSRTIFVILGVARSGTSVIARTLKALGINLGSKLTQPGKWNPTGFWEDNDIVYQINQRLLDEIHFRWDSVKLLDKSLLTQQHAIETSATRILKERFQDCSDWGFKDPRTARLLPFWQSIFSQLKLNDCYVIVLRNPLCSAESFASLGKNDIEKGLLLWLMHLYPAIEETNGKKRIVVSYENVMKNPQHELKRLQHYFDLAPIQADEQRTFTDSFLNKKLDRFPHSYSDLAIHPATQVTPLILKLYDLLLQLANDELSFDDEKYAMLWADIKKDFKQQYPNFCYIDQLLIENHQYRKTLRSIQRAPSWKMTYPLRLLERSLLALRNMRVTFGKFF